jgi:hypothetical protein
VVRYAKDIKLIVTLDSDRIEMIYPPYLEISYEEKSVEDITTSSSAKTFLFSSEYIMDTTGFW